MENLLPRRNWPPITMYSPQLLDHFENPRNAGDLPDADASVELENPVCGDVVRLSLRVEDGRIVAIRFKAKGCVPAIACTSAMTEMVMGKTFQEAHTVTRKELTDRIGSLPQASTHAAQLALDALASALAQIETRP